MASFHDIHALFGVEDMIVVITGGGSGLGRMAAHALAANGAKAVYILGRRVAALNATKLMSPNPDVIQPIVCDISQKESLHAAAQQIHSDHGYCDVLLANAGFGAAATTRKADTVPGANLVSNSSIGELQDSLWQYTAEDFTQATHVNVTGTFYTVVAFLSLLSEGNKRATVPQKSQVVITTSIGAYLRQPVPVLASAAAGLAYAVSKAAASHMAKQMATLLAPHMIRVNTIAPGFYPSEMTADFPFMKSPTDPRQEGSIEKTLVPLQRIGAEQDMGGAVLFLLSRAGGYVNGNVLVTDGGRLSIVPASY
ncbi:hypothetical protein QQS21_006231 [Conoideocrella luteorostrata]|uniref:Short chain dehydrogenase/reductase family n=1 Tax=Conoideocrella luteorostrata TaxID=1105319 RepID=A0AAJ0G0C7_9HYPO|nr:hypothetical protein QQS21_006231 [Conoideocrella luteorostrata]